MRCKFMNDETAVSSDTGNQVNNILMQLHYLLGDGAGVGCGQAVSEDDDMYSISRLVNLY